MRGGRWVEINEPVEEQKKFLREVVIKGLFGRNAVYLGTKETAASKKTGKQKAKNQPQGTIGRNLAAAVLRGGQTAPTTTMNLKAGLLRLSYS